LHESRGLRNSRKGRKKQMLWLSKLLTSAGNLFLVTEREDRLRPHGLNPRKLGLRRGRPKSYGTRKYGEEGKRNCAGEGRVREIPVLELAK